VAIASGAAGRGIFFHHYHNAYAPLRIFPWTCACDFVTSCARDTVAVPARHMHRVPTVSTPPRPLRILWVHSWVQPTQGVRDALSDAGYRAILTRVDIEPALQAAITRRDFELAIVDGSAGIARALVEARFREHHIFAPVIDHDAPATLVRRIERAMLLS